MHRYFPSPEHTQSGTRQGGALQRARPVEPPPLADRGHQRAVFSRKSSSISCPFVSFHYDFSAESLEYVALDWITTLASLASNFFGYIQSSATHRERKSLPTKELLDSIRKARRVRPVTPTSVLVHDDLLTAFRTNVGVTLLPLNMRIIHSNSGRAPTSNFLGSARVR